ncbi:MAG: transketolase family protein [Methanobacteriota archaeon]
MTEPKKLLIRNPRDAYSQALIQLGQENPNVVVLDADLALSTKTKRFGTLFPDRFFDMGIQEANMMGVAAGLACAGKIPYVSTFAAFATGMTYNVIRQSICYADLRVKIVATHGGISVGGDGATHQMLEDIGLMRALPGMTVVAPVDSTEMEHAVKAVAAAQGPCYIRCGRADVPELPVEEPRRFELGKAQVFRPGTDVTLIGTGTMVFECIEAAERLDEERIDARVVSMPTVKPLDVATVIAAARETKGIVTAEEHSVVNGLGSAVAEVLAENHPTRLARIGAQDTFGESGDPAILMQKYGLTAADIAARARAIVAGPPGAKRVPEAKR